MHLQTMENNSNEDQRIFNVFKMCEGSSYIQNIAAFSQ